RSVSYLDQAIPDFYRFLEGGEYNSKSLMVVTGAVFGISYFYGRYVYLYGYITKIWDNYFAQENDARSLLLVAGLQGVSTLIFAITPHYWYVNVAAFNGMLWIILWRRYRQQMSEIREAGYEIRRRPMTFWKDGKAIDPKQNGALLTR